jgi:hypothetical protein
MHSVLPLEPGVTLRLSSDFDEKVR